MLIGENSRLLIQHKVCSFDHLNIFFYYIYFFSFKWTFVKTVLSTMSFLLKWRKLPSKNMLNQLILSLYWNCYIFLKSFFSELKIWFLIEDRKLHVFSQIKSIHSMNLQVQFTIFYSGTKLQICSINISIYFFEIFTIISIKAWPNSNAEVQEFPKCSQIQ